MKSKSEKSAKIFGSKICLENFRSDQLLECAWDVRYDQTDGNEVVPVRPFCVLREGVHMPKGQWHRFL